MGQSLSLGIKLPRDWSEQEKRSVFPDRNRRVPPKPSTIGRRLWHSRATFSSSATLGAPRKMALKTFGRRESGYRKGFPTPVNDRRKTAVSVEEEVRRDL